MRRQFPVIATVCSVLPRDQICSFRFQLKWDKYRFRSFITTELKAMSFAKTKILSKWHKTTIVSFLLNRADQVPSPDIFIWEHVFRSHKINMQDIKTVIIELKEDSWSS